MPTADTADTGSWKLLDLDAGCDLLIAIAHFRQIILSDDDYFSDYQLDGLSTQAKRSGAPKPPVEKVESPSDDDAPLFEFWINTCDGRRKYKLDRGQYSRELGEVFNLQQPAPADEPRVEGAGSRMGRPTFYSWSILNEWLDELRSKIPRTIWRDEDAIRFAKMGVTWFDALENQLWSGRTALMEIAPIDEQMDSLLLWMKKRAFDQTFVTEFSSRLASAKLEFESFFSKQSSSETADVDRAQKSIRRFIEALFHVQTEAIKVTGSADAPADPRFEPLNKPSQANGTTPDAGTVRFDLRNEQQKDLLYEVKRHRAMFLYFSRPLRINPDASHTRTGSRETLEPDEWPAWKQMLEHVDATGNFLVEHSLVFDRYADECIKRFGMGKGVKPNCEGASFPFWNIDDAGGAAYLNESSERLLQACKSVRDPSIRNIILNVIHPHETDRWYSSALVPWEYLSMIDTALKKVGLFQVNGSLLEADPVTVSSLAPGPTVYDSQIALPMQVSPTSNHDIDLQALIDDANSAIMSLAAMRQDRESMEGIGRRMEGGGEDWHFASRTDGWNYDDAKSRLKRNAKGMADLLRPLFDWGRTHGIETYEGVSDFEKDGLEKLCSDTFGGYEFEVRRILSAMLIEQAKSSLFSSQILPNDTPPKEVELSDRKQNILQVLFEKGVFTSDLRVTTEEIAASAEGNGAEPNGFKEPIAELVKAGLIKPKLGRGGGVWLTQAGKDRAEKIVKR